MGRQFVIGSVDWLLAQRAGAFDNRPQIPPSPKKAKGVQPRNTHGLVSMAIKGHGEYCTYCKREMIAYSATHPTRDHVMPKSKGGRKTVWACTKCNHAKGDMLPEEWARYMREFPQWWGIPGRERLGRKAIMATRRKVSAALANGVIPKMVPIAYSDPWAQAAFEAVYRNRLYMLRSEPTDLAPASPATSPFPPS